MNRVGLPLECGDRIRIIRIRLECEKVPDYRGIWDHQSVPRSMHQEGFSDQISVFAKHFRRRNDVTVIVGCGISVRPYFR